MKTKSDVLKDRMLLIILLTALMIAAGGATAVDMITFGDCLIIVTLTLVGFLIDASLGFMVKRG